MIGDKIRLSDMDENFKQAGFEVYASGTYKECLTHLTTHAPDVLLLDVPVVACDWIDCIRDIRCQCQAPLIVLASSVDDVFNMIGLDMGINDFITWPVSPRELVSRVKRVMRCSEQEDRQEKAITRF